MFLEFDLDAIFVQLRGKLRLFSAKMTYLFAQFMKGNPRARVNQATVIALSKAEKKVQRHRGDIVEPVSSAEDEPLEFRKLKQLKYPSRLKRTSSTLIA